MKKVVNFIFSVLFLLVLFGVLCASLLRGQREISYVENRTLAQFPSFQWEEFWSGAYFTKIDAAVDDQIIGRNYFMKAANVIDFAIGRPVVSDMVMPQEKYGPILVFQGYAKDDFDWKDEYVTEMAARLAALNAQITDYGGYFLYVGVSQQGDYYDAAYPSYMRGSLTSSQDTIARLETALAQAQVPFLNMAELFEAADAQPPLFYRTDHHFTFHGALLTYRAALARVNEARAQPIQILQDEDLVLTTLPNPFGGSRNHQVYRLVPTDDALTYAVPRADIAYTRRDRYFDAGGELLALPESPDALVGYTVYMGGDISETIIETNREELPNCLIFGDSFTNAVETLLWTGFNETRSLDLRHYDEMSLSEYIAAWQPDVVLCLRDSGSFLSLTGNGSFF